MTELHPSVKAMAQSMQEKLEVNAHRKGWPTKNGKRGWLKPHCDIEFLQQKLDEEVGELKRAVQELHDAMIRKQNVTRLKENVRFEAADVANVAMMIADNLGALRH